MSKNSIGKRNKRKGSDAERYYAEVFRDLGFSHCKTSREVSKLLDNAKIDLAFIPFNIQIKGGIHKSLNPGKVFVMMEAMVNSMFPKDDAVHGKPMLLVHRKKVYSKHNEKDLLYMSLKQFEEFQKIDESISFHIEKTANFDMDSDFKHIVGMYFGEFKEKIIPSYLD